MKIEYTLVRNSNGKWDMKFDTNLKIRDNLNDIPIGLQENDTITHINGKRVHNSDDVMKIIRKLNTSGANSLKMRLIRDKRLSGEFGRRYPVRAQKNHKIYTLKEMSESNLSRRSNTTSKPKSKSNSKSQSANIIFKNIDGPMSARLKENYFGKKSKKKRTTPKRKGKKTKNKSNTKKKISKR